MHMWTITINALLMLPQPLDQAIDNGGPDKGGVVRSLFSSVCAPLDLDQLAHSVEVASHS